MECYVDLDDGILTLGNSRIRRIYRWHGGP